MQTALKKTYGNIVNGIALTWARYSEVILLLGCFLVPLKLSLTYICFGPAILGWLAYNRECLGQKYKEYRWFLAPWLFFIVSLSSHALFGISPLRSLLGTYSLFLYPIVLFAIADTFRGQRALLPLLVLVLGQTLAGLHSLLDTATAQGIPRFFLGAVTESGQLALVAPLACGLAVTIHRFSKKILKTRHQISRAIFVSFFSVMLSILAFGKELFSIPTFAVTTLVIITSSLLLFISNRKEVELHTAPEILKSRYSFILKYSAALIERFFLPIILAALVVNLKRGPWAGVAIAILAFSLIYSRKLVVPFIIATACVIAIALPVQTRLLESSKDFFIPGGRSAIWTVGIEIAERFPLGIGYKNSKFLNSYSTEIPKELTHFHNNLINILVESGPLTLILFLVWSFSVIAYAFRAKVQPALAPCAKGIGCALIAWQVAGLVEYNFGDSEVLFVVYVLLGAVAGMQKSNDEIRGSLQPLR